MTKIKEDDNNFLVLLHELVDRCFISTDSHWVIGKTEIVVIRVDS